jgi:hypothetical protein
MNQPGGKPMLTLAGKVYAKNQGEAKQESFAGFYRVKTNGILFLDRERIPFAFAAMDPTNGSTFFVTAGKQEDGRTRYMFGLGDYTAKALGIDGMKHSEQADFARDVIRQGGSPLYSRFYRVDESPSCEYCRTIAGVTGRHHCPIHLEAGA